MRLVEWLIDHIEERTRHHSNIMVYADHHRFGENRPFQIGGFTPDVYACTVPDAVRIVGEAKTPGDLESERSARQLAAFADHLALYENSLLLIAVPWRAAPAARSLARQLRTPERAALQIEVHVGA